MDNMEEEIPEYVLRRHKEFVANELREARRNRQNEGDEEGEGFRKSSRRDYPRDKGERNFNGPRKPFGKGQGGGFKKDFKHHSKGGFQRRDKDN